MNGVFGHNSALVRQYWAGTNWANEMIFVMNTNTIQKSYYVEIVPF